MNYKREKEYLENELKNYRYIVDMCYKYEQIIAEAEVAKLGISSPAIKEVIYEKEDNLWRGIDDCGLVFAVLYHASSHQYP